MHTNQNYQYFCWELDLNYRSHEDEFFNLKY